MMAEHPAFVPQLGKVTAGRCGVCTQVNAVRNGASSAVHVSGGRGWLYLTFIVAIVCCGVEV